ncbi:MAG: hypothetical protein Q8K75_04295 [Chlamydiales bacterium]|nr:hypothetical protein [Chlamydiales bacterium]
MDQAPQPVQPHVPQSVQPMLCLTQNDTFEYQDSTVVDSADVIKEIRVFYSAAEKRCSTPEFVKGPIPRYENIVNKKVEVYISSTYELPVKILTEIGGNFKLLFQEDRLNKAMVSINPNETISFFVTSVDAAKFELSMLSINLFEIVGATLRIDPSPSLVHVKLLKVDHKVISDHKAEEFFNMTVNKVAKKVHNTYRRLEAPLAAANRPELTLRSDPLPLLLNPAARTFDIVYKSRVKDEGIVDIKGPIPTMDNIILREIHTHVSHRNDVPVKVSVETQGEFKVKYKNELYSKLSVTIKPNQIKVVYISCNKAKVNNIGRFKITAENFENESDCHSVVDVALLKISNAKDSIEFPVLHTPKGRVTVHNSHYRVNAGEIALTRGQ